MKEKEYRPQSELTEEQDLDFAKITNPLGCSANLEFADQLPEVNKDSLKTFFAEQLGLTKEMVFLSNSGSSGIIECITGSVMKPGMKCAVIQPTYFGLIDSLRENNRQVISVCARREDKFEFTDNLHDDFLHLTDGQKPEFIWLCTPNNPTGVVLPLSKIADIAGRNSSAVIIVDEAYQEIIDPENEKSAVRLLPEHKNIIVTKTFSKAYGLQDIHLGVAVGDPSSIEAFESRMEASDIPQPVLKRTMAAIADKGHLKKTAQYILEEQEYANASINQMSDIELGAVSHIGVMLVRHRKGSLYEMLLRHRIRTYDFSLMNGLENFRFVRIGLKTHEKNQQLIQTLWECDG